jgi:hypothetical protein
MEIKKLLNLPVRNWKETKCYISLVIMPSGTQHESGWANMLIIGLDENRKPIEIASKCDAIFWEIPVKDVAILKTDMFPSGFIHFWSSEYLFKIGAALDTTTIYLIKK